MKQFAALLEALVFMPSRNGKLRLLTDYFSTAPDPDRGWASAVAVKSGRIVAVGDASAVEQLTGPETRTIDLGGRAFWRDRDRDDRIS